jgi:hypothetical protein
VDDNKWIYWKPEIFSDIFARRVFKPLPPREEALSLFRDYFENFNCVFPLFHEPTFMHLVEKQYSRDPYEGSGWWASINVALAISHRLRVMSNLVPQEEDKKAWLYLKNAMGVLTELTMRNADLLSVQALLGMVSLFSPALLRGKNMSELTMLCRLFSFKEHRIRSLPSSSSLQPFAFPTVSASISVGLVSDLTPLSSSSENASSGSDICWTRSTCFLSPSIGSSENDIAKKSPFSASVSGQVGHLHKTTMI